MFVKRIGTTPPATSAGTSNEYSVAPTSTVVASGEGDEDVPSPESDEQAVRSNAVDPTTAMSGRLIGNSSRSMDSPITVLASVTPSAIPR